MNSRRPKISNIVDSILLFFAFINAVNYVLQLPISDLSSVFKSYVQ